MAVITQELITDAYYISNIVSRDFETVSGSQVHDGLIALNDLLGDKTSDSALIPYSSKYTFNTIVGVDNYFIDDLISVDTYAFFLSDVRYQTMNQQRTQYFGSSRAMNIESLPFTWHVERELGGARLYVYPLPSQVFPVEVWGQFSLAQVTQFQDLSLTLSRFYTNFLKFQLAVRLCDIYGYTVPANVEKQLQAYYQTIGNQTNTIDLRTKKLSTLGSMESINWGFVNLAKSGYLPY